MNLNLKQMICHWNDSANANTSEEDSLQTNIDVEDTDNISAATCSVSALVL